MEKPDKQKKASACGLPSDSQAAGAPNESATPPGIDLSKVSVGKLDTAQHIRREMSRVYRHARKGSIPVADGSRLVNMLSLMLNALRDTDLERRIEALERSKHGS